MAVTQCVLVVEDERKIRDLLRTYLEHDGLSVITTGSGAEAITLAGQSHPDLIVLDLRLPDVPGEDVGREFRTHAAIPILMLTARPAPQTAFTAWNSAPMTTSPSVPPPRKWSSGSAPSRARQRRRRSRPAGCYGGGQLLIDETRHQVTAHGQPADLTSTEWKLLTTLASVPGRVSTRYELVNRARGYEYEGYERTIDSHIRNLRRKIDTDPREPGLIETVTGTGYRLAVTHDRTPARPPAAVPDQAAAG